MLIKKNMVHAGTHTLHNNVNIDMALSQKWNTVAKNNVRFYNANEFSLIVILGFHPEENSN